MPISTDLYYIRIAESHSIKITRSRWRIREWYSRHAGNVYVAFSGGKDSTALLHLVRSEYPEVPAVFCDTGLEFPEIRQFVKTVENVITVRPKMTFQNVLKKYGYPIISKEQSRAISRYAHGTTEQVKYYRLHGFPGGKKGMISKKWQFLINAPFPVSDQCCEIMKKQPLNKYAKETGRVPFMGVLATESNSRMRHYLETGCNAFEGQHPKSHPIALWSTDDVWQYLRENKVPYSTIYDMGYKRTGCMFCGFGCHLEKPCNRWQTMKKTHPKHYAYGMDQLGFREVFKYIGVDVESDCEECKQQELNLE